MAINASSKNAGEVPHSGQRERLPGGPGPAAAAQSLPEGGYSALSPVAGLGPATHAFFSPIKRETIVAQMVEKSASADMRATKMLIDMMKDGEHKDRDASPPP